MRDSLTGSADDAWRALLAGRTLHQLGWAHVVRRADPDTLTVPGRVPARVARVDRGGWLLVATGEGPPRRARDRTGARVAVGDWVLVEPSPNVDERPDDAVVLVPRMGVLARRDETDSTHPQVLAANVDVVLVAEALDPDREINAARVARFAAIAAAGDTRPHVLLTGIDRLGSDKSRVPDTVAGIPATATSIVDGHGLDELRALLEPGTTAVVVGASGAGKSSLVNALLDEPLLAVGARRSTGTGRHTTAVGRLVPLPGGAVLVDTPGVRLVGMHADAAVGWSPPDSIGAIAADCRFRDCEHAGEPGCAVAAAVDRGELSQSTVDDWHKLQREAAYELARSDARVRSELRARQRAQGRSVAKARRAGYFRKPS